MFRTPSEEAKQLKKVALSGTLLSTNTSSTTDVDDEDDDDDGGAGVYTDRNLPLKQSIN